MAVFLRRGWRWLLPSSGGVIRESNKVRKWKNIQDSEGFLGTMLCAMVCVCVVALSSECVRERQFCDCWETCMRVPTCVCV